MLAEIDQQHVVSQEVRLPNGSNAFLAEPDGPGPYPTMILLHERYGLVRHTRDLAIRFATEGHVAIAPNLYFREPDQEAINRGDEHGTLTDDQVVEDVGVVIDHLKGVERADVGRLVVMGVCATGRHPLVLSARRSEFKASVTFYGGAYKRDWVPEDTLSEYMRSSSVPVLGVFGELDNSISIEDLQRFRGALESARRSYEIRLFPDAPHGYLNDTMPGRYRRPQAEAAWKHLIAFLDRVHSGGFPPDRVQWSFVADHAVTYDFTKNVRMA